VDTDLAQALLCTKSAEHLYDIRRNVNACADSFKRLSLFVYLYREALALQPSGCSRASKSSSNYGNASLAFHAGPPEIRCESDPMAPTTFVEAQSKRSVRQRAPMPGTAPRADQLSHIRSRMSVTLPGESGGQSQP
jgi:hypothetical protein